MLILDSPGQLVGYIHCRTVHVDPEMFPPPRPWELPGAAALHKVRRPRRGNPERDRIPSGPNVAAGRLAVWAWGWGGAGGGL